MKKLKNFYQNKNINFIILGVSGSGKGTQAELLAKELNLKIVDGGAYLRSLIKSKEISVSGVKRINRGKLAPTKIVKDWLENQIQKNCKRGFIISGQPRMLEEAKFVLRCFIENKCSLPKVIFLRVSKKEVYKRLRKRYLREKRADDLPKGIKNRLEYFETNVKKVIDYFRKKNILIEIDGEQSIENVHKDILKAINR